MELSYRFIDILRTPRSAGGFADLPPKTGARGVWYIPKSSVLAPAIEWQTVHKEKRLEVPLVPYLMQPDVTHVFGFAAQLGLIVRNSFQAAEIGEVKLSIGNPVEEVATSNGNMWRVYFGVAVLVL